MNTGLIGAGAIARPASPTQKAAMKPERKFIPDYDNIYVVAAPPQRFKELAKEHMDGWDDLLFEHEVAYEMGLLVLTNNDWFGALLVRRAETQSLERDHWLGWSTYHQVERSPLVLEVLEYLPRWEACYRPDYGVRALQAAISRMAEMFELHYGYKPLLADCHMDPDGRMPDYFRGAGWILATEGNPEKLSSYWINELVPRASEIMTAKNLDKAYTAGTSRKLTGLLPISEHLLPSLRDAFKAIDDDRATNKKHPQHSILATIFLALLCGFHSVNGIVKFSRRLSVANAQMLGFKVDLNGCAIIPKYHTFYRVLGNLDRLQLSECFVRWVEVHEKELPRSLQFTGRVMRDALITFVKYLGRRHPQ
ncbi:transposase family protein [Pontiella desulfatans]|nr:transposase family protein [Pontiella desulfatans]